MVMSISGNKKCKKPHLFSFAYTYLAAQRAERLSERSHRGESQVREGGLRVVAESIITTAKIHIAFFTFVFFFHGHGSVSIKSLLDHII